MLLGSSLRLACAAEENKDRLAPFERQINLRATIRRTPRGGIRNLARHRVPEFGHTPCDTQRCGQSARLVELVAQEVDIRIGLLGAAMRPGDICGNNRIAPQPVGREILLRIGLIEDDDSAPLQRLDLRLHLLRHRGFGVHRARFGDYKDAVRCTTGQYHAAIFDLGQAHQRIAVK